MANYVHNNVVVGGTKIIIADKVSKWRPICNEAEKISEENPTEITVLYHHSPENNCAGYYKFRNGELLSEYNKVVFSEQTEELFEDIIPDEKEK